MCDALDLKCHHFKLKGMLFSSFLLKAESQRNSREDLGVHRVAPSAPTERIEMEMAQCPAQQAWSLHSSQGTETVPRG